ncbi:unnamed protein product [Paramecium sonneborni]|uniref:PSI domain-containing protein n=1 Tax=Paramecium sonneborni TaxID=65129 RepID=A0A8S1RGS7_9CILI|nr:unnamed protein product [Paramecium sonneborni]
MTKYRIEEESLGKERNQQARQNLMDNRMETDNLQNIENLVYKEIIMDYGGEQIEKIRFQIDDMNLDLSILKLMKSYLLIAIFISLGIYQIVATSQTTCGCTQLTNPTDCSTLPGCSWNTTSSQCLLGNCGSFSNRNTCLQASNYCEWNLDQLICQNFQTCQDLNVTGMANITNTTTWTNQCVLQNSQCLGYNPQNTTCERLNSITLSCNQLEITYCNGNVGSDGVCYWNQATTNCTAVNSCSQVNTLSQVNAQKYCELLNQNNQAICQWNSNSSTCQSITNCNQLTEDQCKYFFTNTNFSQMTSCIWNNGVCSNTTISSLPAQNCMSSTAYTYRWFSPVNNPKVGICTSCKPIPVPMVTLFSKSQCSCSQYQNPQDCNSQSSSLTSQNGPCIWTNNACVSNSCSNIKNQNDCIVVQSCFWNFGGGGSCQQQNSCQDLTYKYDGVGCAAQSVYCPNFSGGFCAPSTNLQQCNTQATSQTCKAYIGSDGLCIWSKDSCVPLKFCNQIFDQAYCSGQSNICYWNGLACAQLSCSNLSQQNCKYVITSFQESQYQYCKWNGQACVDSYSGLALTSQNCVSNTGNTFRWSTNNTAVGMCVSCGINQLAVQTASSCQCSQLYSQANCNNTGFCTYNTDNNTCTPAECKQYTNQVTCASLSGCYWSGSSCKTFTACSQLTNATNQLECISMNNSCKGFSSGSCQTNPTGLCSANTVCNNTIGTDGLCFLNSTNQCVGFSQCSLASSITTGASICQKYSFSCSWNATNNTCSQITCNDFKTQLNCKFYIPNPISNEIIPCSWNATQGCVTANDILTQLNPTTCAASTHNTYTWISTQASASANKGLCIRCQEQVALPNSCGCSHLGLTDCSQASDCQWTNNQCITLACSQIVQQTFCASQLGCAWIKNACSSFNGCNTLLGSTQAACMQQNAFCVGSNGTTCTNTYNPCASNSSETSCVTALGSDGACYWNSAQCVAVSSCTQLPESACKLRTKSCYWADNSCQTQTCSTLYSQYHQCTYVVSLLSNKNVQFCSLVNNLCIQTKDPQNLNKSNCFTSSNRTARWVSNKSGSLGVCLSCNVQAANLIPIQSSQLCQCYQYMTQTECNAASVQSCIWQNTSTGTTNPKYACVQQACNLITSQSLCALNTSCYWDYNTTACASFTTCSSITGSDLTAALCLSYSVQCRGSTGKACSPNPQALCSSLTTQEQCNTTPGSDGVCHWNSTGTGSCSVITSCTQITNQKNCQYFSNICQYVTSGTTSTCEALTCSSFTTPSLCKYVVKSFATGEIQQCQWSAQTCINMQTSQSLTSSNCQSNTGFTYRWYPTLSNSGDGYCTKCAINTLYVPGQCACSQLIQQQDCLSNLQCSWSTSPTTPSCYNKPCSQILQQSVCSTNPRCAWSVATSTCQPFSQCDDLSGINSGECASYSIFCAATSTTLSNYDQKFKCAPTANQKCSNVTPAPTGASTNQQLNCENTFVSSSICLYNSTTKQCTQITSCSQILSQSKCQRLIHSCYWQPASGTTAAQCTNATCPNITNQLDCTYVSSTLSTPSKSSITQCFWQQNTGCVSAQQASIPLTNTTCYSNSFMMSRWITTQAGGKCVQCNQYSAGNVFKPICSCSSLSQSECTYASPQCTVNGTSCVEQPCTGLSQNQCAINQKCIYLGGACQNYTSTNTCGNITSPKSNYDCAQYSTNCLQYNGTTSTCSNLDCSKLSTNVSCASVEFCSWTNDKCQTINNCKQITDVALCSLQTNRCQWSVVFNSCVTQSCSSYTSQADCTYVYTSYSQADVALCYWDTFYNDCRSASLSLLSNFTQNNTATCYVNTGHLYHLDEGECTRCFQNILSILLITVLLLFI